MANVMRAQVTFSHLSGVAKDNVVNTLAIKRDAAGDWVAADADHAMTWIMDYLDGVNATGLKIASYLSGELSRAVDGVTVRFFDAFAGGSPLFTRTGQLGAAAAGAAPMPGEVAIAHSFRGDYSVGLVEEGPVVTDLPTPRAAQRMGAPATHSGRTRPRSSVRGRFYLGPLNDTAKETVSAVARPKGLMIGDMVTAFDRAYTVGLPSSGLHLGVLSRAVGVFTPHTHQWVDNAFDTQRRRGLAPTAKTAGTSGP